MDVDGDADAGLLAGHAALAGLPVALGEVGVVYVGLVHPDGVARHVPVLADGHRCERAVPPLEGGLVGDAAQLGRALDGDVVAHVTDEGDPDGERLPAVLEDGAREGGEPPAAAAVAPPRDAGGGGVPATTGGSTGRPRSSARPPARHRRARVSPARRGRGEAALPGLRRCIREAVGGNHHEPEVQQVGIGVRGRPDGRRRDRPHRPLREARPVPRRVLPRPSCPHAGGLAAHKACALPMLRLLNFRCSFCSNPLDETHPMTASVILVGATVVSSNR